MCKRVMIVGLFVIGMIAMVGVEANAGCIPRPPTPQYCAAWIRGSLIGENLCHIDSEILTKGCIPGQTCPTTTYTVSGTINPDTGQVCNLNDPESCATPVLVTCWQKKCATNPNNPNCGVDHQVKSTFFFPGLITEASADLACQKKNCRVSKTSATFFNEEDLEALDVCAQGHVVKDAAVLQFVGGTLCCSGGYGSDGQCCADQNRGPGGTCAVPGTPKDIKQICCNGDTLGVGEAFTCFVAENGVFPNGLPAGCNPVN